MGGPPKDPDHVSGLATFHECTTIMFMDIVGFTSMSKEVQPDQVSWGGPHNPSMQDFDWIQAPSTIRMHSDPTIKLFFY